MEELNRVTYKVKEVQISAEELLKKLELKGTIRKLEFFKSPLNNIIMTIMEEKK